MRTQKKEYLRYGKDLNKGLQQKSLQKVSDETLLCSLPSMKLFGSDTRFSLLFQ